MAASGLAARRRSRRAERLVEPPVRHDVGVELVVLVREKRVRPARRGDERRAPGALAHRPRRGRAHLHAPLGRRRGRIEVGLGERLGEAGAKAALGDHPPAIAVDLERDDRVAEAHAVVVEEHDGVEEGMREAGVVQRRVGVRHVDVLLEEPPREELAGLPMARHRDHRVLALAPDIVPGVPLPVPRLDLVVRQHAERRNDVRREVLVLVVAPDDHHVGPEVVEELPRVAEVAEQDRPVRGRRRGAAVGPVLPTHRLGPSGRVAVALGQAGILHDGAQDVGHVLVVPDERRVMRHAQPEDLAHVVPPGVRRTDAWADARPPSNALSNQAGALARSRSPPIWRR